MRRIIGAAAIFCCTTVQLFGQSLELYRDDALRFSTPGLGVGARALGMGGAYTGVANDYSALFWNPAGLAQMEYGEFSFGLFHTNFLDGSNLLSSSTSSQASNATKLNALGIAYPIPVQRGSLVLAFGYQRENDFTTGLSFNGFSPNSSIIQSDPYTWAPDGSFYPSDVSNNIAYQLYLADLDTLTGKFISPIKGQLTQVGKTTEEGGLNNWSAGGAIDVGKNLSVGVTLTYVSGTYKYNRNYQEQDTKNVYTSATGANFDFDQLVLDDNVETDITGVNAKLGLMYRQPDHFRIGLTIKTPTSFRIKESFSTTAQSFFDNGFGAGPLDFSGSDEYDIVTPWVFGAGASVMIQDLVLSGDVDYTDWTSLELQNANNGLDLVALNQNIKDNLRGAANLRAGAEYDLRGAGLRLRVGGMYNTSPHRLFRPLRILSDERIQYFKMLFERLL